MKVLHVITSLHFGGAEKLMVDLLPRLCNSEDKVDLLLFDGTRTPFYEMLEERGVKIYHLTMGGNVYNPINVFRIIKYLRLYDIIHTHNTAPQLFVAITTIFLRKKIVTTEHSTSNRRRNWSWYRWLDKWMYSRYQNIICISDQASENLCKYIEPIKKKVLVIYNGVDVGQIFNSQPSITLKDQFHNCVTAIMVGRFCYQKDQKTVIQAYKLLPSKHHILFAGTGPLMNECKELAYTLGVAERVHFLGNRIDIPVLLKSVDLVILSSHFEGLSLASIEGMASGKPFLASELDWLREILKGNGVLFPHENADALANEIEKLCNEPLYREEIIHKCCEKSISYDISIMAQKYKNVYQSIIKS